MTRDAITDPEIIADMRARNRVAGGLDRPIEVAPKGPLGGAWAPPEIVEGWACRARCGRFVPATAEALARWADANRALQRRGLEPIGKHEVLFCASCKSKHAPERGDARRRQADAMADAIRELKGLVDNDLRERSLIARLRDLGHPDVDGLVRAVRESRAAKIATTPRRKSL